MKTDSEFALQQINEMCGAQALFLAAKSARKSVTYEEISKLLGKPDGGFSIANIERSADQLGISTSLGRMPIREFLEKSNIAILRLPQKSNNQTGYHYFVLNKIDAKSFLLFNPPFSVASYSIIEGPSHSYEGISIDPYKAEGKSFAPSWNICLLFGVSVFIIALILKRLFA